MKCPAPSAYFLQTRPGVGCNSNDLHDPDRASNHQLWEPDVCMAGHSKYSNNKKEFIAPQLNWLAE